LSDNDAPPSPTKQDKHDSLAVGKVLEVVQEQGVVTDRELKVRLELDFFPWVVSRALRKLLNDGKLQKKKLPGRKSSRPGTTKKTESFFVLAGTQQEQVLSLMREKQKVSMDIIALLQGNSPFSEHAEDVFRSAFESLGFKIEGVDVSEYNGKKAIGVDFKEPPNVDFVVSKDNLVYGVDIKNWIRYEWDNKQDVLGKVNVAVQLGTIPFIVARYIDKDTIYKRVMPNSANYGIVYRYETLIFPSYHVSLANKASSLLGYPTLAVDNLPEFKIEWIRALHALRLAKARRS